MSRRTRIGSVCLLVPLIGFFVAGPLWLLISQPGDRFYWMIEILGAGVAALLGYMLRAALVTSVTLLPDGLRYTNGWGRQREWRYDELSGYRTIRLKNGTQLQVVPVASAGRPFQISTALERRAELESTLTKKLRDLDQKDFGDEMKQLLADERFGSSGEERASALARATRLARGVNLSVVPLLFWGMIYPHPYGLVMTLAALLPLVAVGLAAWTHGLITLDTKKNNPRPNLLQAVMFPSWLLGLRALQDWNILDWSGFWTPFATLAAGQLALFWYVSPPERRRKAGALLTFAVLGLAQSFGLTLFLNCYLDHSVAAVHQAVVQSHRISRGKHTSYYLLVRPWLDGNGTHEVSVDRSLYDQHLDGSELKIFVCKGTLSMTWFFVR